MKNKILCIFLLILPIWSQEIFEFKIDKIFPNNTAIDVAIYAANDKGKRVRNFNEIVSITGLKIEEETTLLFQGGELKLKAIQKTNENVVVTWNKKNYTVAFPKLGGFKVSKRLVKNILSDITIDVFSNKDEIIDFYGDVTIEGISSIDDNCNVLGNSTFTFDGNLHLEKVKIASEAIQADFQGKKYPIIAPDLYHFAIKEHFANNIPLTLTIQAIDGKGNILKDYDSTVTIKGIEQRDSKDQITDQADFKFENGVLVLERTKIVKHPLMINEKNKTYNTKYNTFHSILTLVPPLIAIILAIVTKEVLLSLFIGVWAGVFILSGYSLLSILDTFTVNLVGTLSDHAYMQVIVFTCTIGGMIGIVSKSGGIHDLVEKISHWATSPRSGMISTYLMGVVIFFDDYANTLIVGNSMKPITDKLKISREKLAYIVDSTAAPICSIVLISTWIGTELGYIGGALDEYGQGKRAFDYFYHSIPFHFYSIFTLVFVFMIAYSLRDYGPMLKAEKRTRSTGEVLGPNAMPLSTAETIEAPEGKPHRWLNAIIPIFVVIIATVVGLYIDGSRRLGDTEGAKLMEIVGKADSYIVLLWAAFWGSVSAFILITVQGIMNVKQVVEAWVGGAKSMLLAVLVLVLAWTLKDICKELGTNKYIYYGIKDLISVKFLPTIGFVLSAVVAFSTGTSWGTMGLLFPLLIPLGIDLSDTQLSLALDLNNYILLGTLGSVLAGATFGDHCSPISDTTVMSSMASSCDHIDHVKTQIPYALTCGIVSCLFGYLPIGFGAPVWLCLLLGCLAMYIVIHVLGRKSE